MSGATAKGISPELRTVLAETSVLAVAGKAAVLLDRFRSDVPRPWFELAVAMREAGCFEAAVACLRNALAHEPDSLLTLLLLGQTLLTQLDWPRARIRAGFHLPQRSKLDFWQHFHGGDCADYDRLIVISEIYNVGLDLTDAGLHEDALVCFRTAARYLTNFNDGHYALGASCLALGRYAEAAPAMLEWADRERARSDVAGPYWQGEPLPGKTLFVFAAKALGDAAQFMRFIPLAAARCQKLLLFLYPSRRRMFARTAMPENVEVISDPSPSYDAFCTLFMLPHAIGIDASTMAMKRPYLGAEPALVDAWRERLPKLGLRIGIAWRGSDPDRAVPLRCFAPLATIPGVTLVCLQIDVTPEELAELPAGTAVTMPGPDFDAGPDSCVDMMAVMQNLDVVVSACTGAAHIAGAMGRPTLVLLRAVADWRWGREGDETPWYPTMRLFWQAEPGNWAEVMDRVAAAVAAMEP